MTLFFASGIHRQIVLALPLKPPLPIKEKRNMESNGERQSKQRLLKRRNTIQK